MEFTEALAVLWCCVTYWLGGQTLPVFNRGFKSIRRYVMPIGLCIFLVVLGVMVEKVILACLFLSLATHLGYQNKVWKYAACGLALGVPTLFISYPTFNWMMLIPMIFHTLYGWVSLRFNVFRWAFVAEIMGIGIGIAYVTSIT